MRPQDAALPSPAIIQACSRIANILALPIVLECCRSLSILIGKIGRVASGPEFAVALTKLKPQPFDNRGVHLADAAFR